MSSILSSLSLSSSNQTSQRNVVALIRSLRTEFSALAHDCSSRAATKFDNVNQLMDKFCFADDEWIALGVFQEHQYSRVLLYSNEHFSVMLLCWLPGQRTPIHAHNADEMCWVRVVSGTLTHTLYQGDANADDEFNELMSCRLNSASGIARHKGMTPHAMANDTKDVRAVSIHVYSPTYLECCFFSGGLRRRIPFVYRALDRLDDHSDHHHHHHHHHHHSGVLTMAPSPSSSSDGDTATPIYASLDELVATLRTELAVERAVDRSPATIARVRQLLEQFRFNQEEWQQYASFTSGAYTRNLIGYDEKFTLLLLCWPAGLASGIHDHAEASCWMKILSGRMRETRYAFPGDATTGDDAAHKDESSLTVTQVTDLGPEEAAYIDDSRGLHKMGNASQIAPSVSLHIYSPPFARCRVFDEATGATREVSLRSANACPNPFMESDLGALALPIGSTFRVPPSSPDAPPASVADLCARLRATFATGVPKDVRNEQLCHLLNDARFAKQEWDEYVHFSERRYQRVLLAFDENFSLVLNCWNKQQATPVHRHHGRDAWIRVVAGELALSHFAGDDASGEPLAVQRLEPKHGATFFGANAIGLHKLANASDSAGAVSLHLYSPPLVNLRAHCTHAVGAASPSSGDDAMPPPSPDDVPVVYCAKALQPRAIDTQVARARSATAVFGNFQSFVGAIKMCLTGPSPHQGVSQLIAQYHFRPDEWMSYMNDDLSARTLIGLGGNFAVIMRFWPANQSSAPHTHGEADCWVKVLHGCVENVLYERTADGLKATSTKRFYAGNAGIAMDRTTIHSMHSVCDSNSLAMPPPPPPAVDHHDGLAPPAALPSAVTLHVFVGHHADAVAFSSDGSESTVDVSGMYSNTNR